MRPPLHLDGFKHLILQMTFFHGGLESQCTAVILGGKRPLHWKSGLLFVKCRLNGCVLVRAFINAKGMGVAVW